MSTVTKNQLPASFLYERQEDPAHGMDGTPPNFGQPVLNHIHTVNGRYGLVSHSYLNVDEALNDSRANAYRMRADCGIMESLEARQRATALLNWHIEPEDARSQDQVELAKQMNDILTATPRFTEMRRSLLEALWYGRHMTCATFKGDHVMGRRRIVVKNWQPRNGDKLKFRYDDGTLKYVEGQVGIRVGTAYAGPRVWLDKKTGDVINKIQPTEEGLVYWLDKWERETCIVHHHMVEDAPYWEPRFAGRIYGVGIRDRIYWSWYAMIECLQRVIEYLDRAAFGIEVWPYQAGNARAKDAASSAAKEAMGGGRTVILAPLPNGENPELYLPKLIEPGLGGVNTTIDVIKTYFGHKIKRYILGQTLTSEADATGLGSGVADAHLATLADIVQYDSVNLEETIRDDFLRILQLKNFPDSDHIKLNFRIDTEEPDAERKMAGFQAAWNMGLAIKAQDVADVIGTSIPDPDDQTLVNPAIQAAAMASYPNQVDADNDGVVNEGQAGERIGTPEELADEAVVMDQNSGGVGLNLAHMFERGRRTSDLHNRVMQHLNTRSLAN